MKNIIHRLLPLLLVSSMPQAYATSITLAPPTQVPTVGSAFDVPVSADIDVADEIIGFGFDLLPSANVGFLGFTPGAGFADDPVYLAPYSDGDGIRGASEGSLLTGVPVSGNGIILGLLHLVALASGPASVSVTADDLASNFTEGLIPYSIDLVNFMPGVSGAAFDIAQGSGVVGEPPVPVALGLAALGWTAIRRRTAARPVRARA